jgi:outer membrane protein
MKKIMLLAITLLTIYATSAFADTKIGVINMQDLLQKLPQMKQIGDDLKNQFGSRQKQLVNAQTSFKGEAEKFRRDNAVLSDKDKQATEDKLFKEQQNIQKMQMDLQKDYMAAQNKEIDALMSQIKDVVDKVAADGKFDLILINASVAYAKKDLDLTNQVLQKIIGGGK